MALFVNLIVTENKSKVFAELGVLTESSGPYAGMKSEDAMKAIVSDAEKRGFGRWSVQVFIFTIRLLWLYFLYMDY